jgi:hypothetical protein
MACGNNTDFHILLFPALLHYFMVIILKTVFCMEEAYIKQDVSSLKM